MLYQTDTGKIVQLQPQLLLAAIFIKAFGGAVNTDKTFEQNFKIGIANANAPRRRILMIYWQIWFNKGNRLQPVL